MTVTGATPLGAYELSAKPNVLKAVPILADWIDPFSGDLTRLNESRTIVDGAVIEGFRVERRSGAAVMNVGQSVREVRHTDDSSLAELPTRAREGIAELERQGLARAQEITVTTSEYPLGDGATINVEVVDFTTNPSEKRTIQVGLSS